jgi:molybdate transport system substrate-binding protein
VAAAADLEPAFSSLASLYQRRYRREIVFSFAGSMALSQQIEHGAPFDLFAAASQHHIEALVAKGRIVPGSLRRYARGALVLWTRPASPRDAVPAPPLPAGIEDLTQPSYRRIAVANPDHAPYGLAAIQALRAAGLYDALKPRLVFGENIRQAHQFVATGNADVVLDARSLAIAAGTPYSTVAAPLYQPLLQALGRVRGGDEEGAAAFVDLLLGDEGQQVLRRFGFDPP